jgi:hypothetical protein
MSINFFLSYYLDSIRSIFVKKPYILWKLIEIIGFKNLLFTHIFLLQVKTCNGVVLKYIIFNKKDSKFIIHILQEVIVKVTYTTFTYLIEEKQEESLLPDSTGVLFYRYKRIYLRDVLEYFDLLLNKRNIINNSLNLDVVEWEKMKTKNSDRTKKVIFEYQNNKFNIKEKETVSLPKIKKKLNTN